MKKVSVIFALVILVFACNQTEEKPATPEVPVAEAVNYSELGNHIATQTQQALGGELKAALQRGGVAEAINYCNLNALPITDSLSAFYKVSIKRATAKPRNPANAATTAEQEILSVWEDKKANGGEISPVLFEGEKTVDFYSPIVLQELCTACHGIKGKTFTVETEAIIKAKYPEDKAIDYNVGDLRGMWHIVFEKK